MQLATMGLSSEMKRASRFSLFPFRRKHRLKRTDPAFTLIEVLVGSALSVIVVSSLAAIALVSELKMGREAEVNQGLRDNWDRALSFITNEARQANWIRTSLSADTQYPCEGSAPSGVLLVLEGPPDPNIASAPTPLWTVVYGVRPNNDAESRRNWRGFNRLVRCGPPYVDASVQNPHYLSLAGNLDVLGVRKETVIADQLAEDDPFQVQLFNQNTDGTELPDRIAQLNLFLSRRTGQTYPPKPASTNDYQTWIRVNRAPGYEVAGNQTTCATSTGVDAQGNPQEQPNNNCLRRESFNERGTTVYTQEWNLTTRSGNLTINGDPETVDVVFLKGPWDSFSFEPCNRASCTLSNASQTVTITDGNVLLFYDRILRL